MSGLRPPGRQTRGPIPKNRPTPLPGIPFLEGKDQNDPAEQAGETDEFLAFHMKPAVHEQHLSDDQEERERDDHDTAESAF